MPEVNWWKALFAAVDGKNTSAFLKFLTPDAEFRFANAPAAFGHAAVGESVEGFFGAIGSSAHTLNRTWQDEDSAICEGTVTYTRLDGSELTVPFANVFYMRDGLIARYLIFIDQGDLFAA
jgi:ketosteroid isomerase-like protein